MEKTGKIVRLIGGSLAILGTVVFFISGYGYQWEWWGLGFAFNYLLKYGAYMAIAGCILSIVGFIPKLGGFSGNWVNIAIAGFILGGITTATAVYWYQEAKKYPPIHDITTDTQNPPTFDAIVPLRKDAPNQTAYGGPEIAEIQKQHYPDINTLSLELNYAKAFEKALETARAFPWEIVNHNSGTGKIEATHTLLWYGFKDDVVIRVDTAATDSAASIVDVRSVSRIGRGDIGVNAHRIREYLEKLKQ